MALTQQAQGTKSQQTLVQTQEEIHLALSSIEKAERNIVAVDTETFGLEWDRRVLLGLSISITVDGTLTSYYFPFRHRHDGVLFASHNLSLYLHEDIKRVLQDKVLIFHNAKFDLQVLKKDGLDLDNYFYDTMLLSHMTNENRKHGLKNLGASYFGEIAKHEAKILKDLVKKIGSWEAVPPEIMGPYAMKDTELTYKLYPIFWKDMSSQELDSLWEREQRFCKVLQNMEELGVGLNLERAKQLAEKSEIRMTQIRAELGFDPQKPDQLANKLFSTPPEGLGFVPGQLSASRTPKFPKGRPVMDEAALKKFSHPVVGLVLEYRGLMKALSTWYKGFPAKMCRDGRLRTSYNQHGTVTTRLSSSEPNLQQLPREGPVRSLLAPMEGYELWELDYSQLEFRLAACYADEPTLIEAYQKNSDFHQLTADKLGISRYDGKQLNFAILYGAGPKKISELFKVNFDTAREIKSAFWSQYPKLKEVFDAAHRAASHHGFIKLWTGRRRHFEWESEHQKAFNSAIQGGAGEIVKESMLNIPANIRLVGQVHDSLWIEVPRDEPERSAQLNAVKAVMEWPGREFKIPFPVDMKRLG